MVGNAGAGGPELGDVLILGRGRVGRSLSLAFDAAGVVHVLRPSRPATAFAAELPSADVVLLAVPDGAIGTTASTVVSALTDGHAPAVVHLSGALGLDVLSAAAERGCATGSLHPLLPFATVRPPESFHGTTIGIEASDDALSAKLAALAEAIGARPRHVPDEQRVLYHAAAVIVSASVVALAAQASDLLEQLGWPRDDALGALLPLMQGAVDNLTGEGLPGALTGPWRRGDAGTVARHISALRASDRPLTLDAYLALGREAIDLARGTGLDEAACTRLRATFDAAVR
jgi:predicted short-subunit dehydrogenase-like oxidoreductase (DUF2520 family)